MSSSVLHHSSAIRPTTMPFSYEQGAQLLEAGDLLFLGLGDNGGFHQQAVGLRRLLQPAQVVRQRLQLHAEQLAQRAVDVQMDARLVVGVADLLDALRDVGREGKQLLPFQAHVILDDGEGGVRQQVHPLQDRAVELERVVLVAGGEDRDRRFRDGRAVLGRDDLRHRLLVRKRGGVQQRLREAIAHRRVHGLAAAAVLVELPGVGAELRRRLGPSAEGRSRCAGSRCGPRRGTLDRGRPHPPGSRRRNPRTRSARPPTRASPRRSSPGSTIFLKPGESGFAVKEKAILPGARLHRHQIAMHVTGSSYRANNRSNAHVVSWLVGEDPPIRRGGPRPHWPRQGCNPSLAVVLLQSVRSSRIRLADGRVRECRCVPRGGGAQSCRLVEFERVEAAPG